MNNHPESSLEWDALAALVREKWEQTPPEVQATLAQMFNTVSRLNDDLDGLVEEERQRLLADFRLVSIMAKRLTEKEEDDSDTEREYEVLRFIQSRESLLTSPQDVYDKFPDVTAKRLYRWQQGWAAAKAMPKTASDLDDLAPSCKNKIWPSRVD